MTNLKDPLPQPTTVTSELNRSQSYRSPLEERYASKEMLYLFSAEWKHKTWRKLWLYLAEAERELGLPISEAALSAMRSNLDNISWEEVRAYENRFRHDVMAHVHAFGDVAPEARGIIHLGATSAYVVDNTDIIEMREALLLVKVKLLAVAENLKHQAERYKKLPTLGYTHFQPAQPVTVGKRLTLYLQEILLDLEELDFIIETLPLRGIKGATGTQASFLTLFAGDHEKVKALDAKIAEKCGFTKRSMVTGQTSSRKLDYRVASWLSGLAQTASKFAVDMRLLQHKRELAEPFGSEQIGSSAMAFKRNPMRAERIGSLARFVMALPASFAYTASSQWFERTLDDSANRRLSMPEAFLAMDGILELMGNITAGMEVYPEMIRQNLMRELPFMVLETLMMQAVKEKGADRQELHEVTRKLSLQLSEKINQGTLKDPHDPLKEFQDIILTTYEITATELAAASDPKHFIGRSDVQVDDFINEVVHPTLERSYARLKTYGKTRELTETELRV